MLTVDRVADTSITLDGRGGSDQYHVALGLGTFLNVTVADSDPSTQNSLVVDSRQDGILQRPRYADGYFPQGGVLHPDTICLDRDQLL